MARKGTTKFNSNLQEKRVAEEVNGRVQIASGSIWTMPSDVRTDDLLIECKTTEKEYYTLNIKTWEKIEKEATKDGLRTPVMSIDTASGRFAITNYPLTVDDQEPPRVKEVNITYRVSIPNVIISFVRFDKHLYCYEWKDFLKGYKASINGK